jgi:thiol-disulfide isomerase/thioredoxin
MNWKPLRAVTLGAAAIAALAPSQATRAGQGASQSAKFAVDPTALAIGAGSKYKVGYMPIPVVLSTQKPAGIKKEPAYAGTPMYGTIHIGNGPASTFTIVLDEPATGDWKVYIDKNQNGDLTDDGDSSWAQKNERKNDKGEVVATVYGVNNVTLRASWGTAGKETSSADYGIGLYTIAMPGGKANTFMFREAARVGELTFDGKPHKTLLIENDGDGIYSKTVAVDATGKPTSKVTGKPMWLKIDTGDDGKFATTVDPRAAFKVGEKVYEAKISDDGASVFVAPTTKVAAQLTPPAPVRKPLLAAGAPVPAFAAEKWGGGTVTPADYKGKVLILDFWATWCGPCQRSMPHLEKVYKAVKGKGVDVLAVCVWDEKDAYTKWVPANQSKYSFPLAFDPAGRSSADSIAGKLFNVSGIPTTYIIGSDGKVADSIVGYQDGDTRVEQALKKLGVDVPVEAAANK